jgi:hypothetical protein
LHPAAHLPHKDKAHPLSTPAHYRLRGRERREGTEREGEERGGGREERGGEKGREE